MAPGGLEEGGPSGLPGAPCSASPLLPRPRPLKNSSDGALMDDNQNEWGDEDLETKKFRVSRGLQGFPGYPLLSPDTPSPEVTWHGCLLGPPFSLKSRWFFLTWMTRQTTGSGPSNTWTPPTCECPPWPPRRRRARPMQTAWTSTSAGLVSAWRPPGAPRPGPLSLGSLRVPDPTALLLPSPGPRGQFSERCAGVGESTQPPPAFLPADSWSRSAPPIDFLSQMLPLRHPQC